MVRFPGMKPRLEKLSATHSLNARSIKQVRQALRRAVAFFEEDDSIRFRNRSLGNEAFINAAVWHLAEMDRAQQEKILRTYIARLEAFLGPVDDEAPAIQSEGTQGEAVFPKGEPSRATPRKKRSS